MTKIFNIDRFLVTSLLISSSSLFVAKIPSQALTIVPPDSTVEGKTIGEWTAEWWKWALSQSTPNDAFTDTTGVNAGVNQSGPVFFVAGTTGGNATRSFTVPANKYLLFPLINVSGSEANSPDEQDLENSVTSLADSIDSAFLEVNGLSIVDNSNFSDYREPSSLFSYTAVPNNVFDDPVGDSGEAYADGYYVMVAPLEEGTQTFRFGGAVSQFGFSFEIENTITAISVPEPTSVISLLAIGSLVTVTIKHKHKAK